METRHTGTGMAGTSRRRQNIQPVLKLSSILKLPDSPCKDLTHLLATEPTKLHFKSHRFTSLTTRFAGRGGPFNDDQDPSGRHVSHGEAKDPHRFIDLEAQL